MGRYAQECRSFGCLVSILTLRQWLVDLAWLGLETLISRIHFIQRLDSIGCFAV